MKTTVEPVEGAQNTVKLSVTIEEAEFERSIEAAFKKIAYEVNIPGFRRGKIPRRILEQRIGKEAARQQALQDSLPEFYVQALGEASVDAISAPELDLAEGAESGPITFHAVVEVRPTIRVPGYDGLAVTIPSPAASEEEIDAQVDRMRAGSAALTEVDRQAQPGDSVRIDITGTVNGEVIPGLVAQGYVYEVGSGGVVPELDDALTGASGGAALAFDAKVPGDDTADPIHFDVTVEAVLERVLPDANDEWAAGASEFATIAELRADIAKRMSLVKRVQATMAMRDETVKALVELVGDDAPETLVNQEIERNLQDMAQRLAQQGASIEMYLAATGQTEEQLIAEARESADGNVKADLALRAVADAEGIDVSDDEVDVEIANLAKRFKMKPNQVRRNLERNYQMPVLVADIRKAKALTWLAEHATVVDPDGKTIDRTLLEVGPGDFAEAGMDAPGVGDDLLHDHDHDHDHEGHDHD